MSAENFAEQGGGRRKAVAIIGDPATPFGVVGRGGTATRARQRSRLTVVSKHSERQRDDNAAMRNLTRQMLKDFIKE